MMLVGGRSMRCVVLEVDVVVLVDAEAVLLGNELLDATECLELSPKFGIVADVATNAREVHHTLADSPFDEFA